MEAPRISSWATQQLWSDRKATAIQIELAVEHDPRRVRTFVRVFDVPTGQLEAMAQGAWVSWHSPEDLCAELVPWLVAELAKLLDPF